jgi:hypothetical protein
LSIIKNNGTTMFLSMKKRELLKPKLSDQVDNAIIVIFGRDGK